MVAIKTIIREETAADEAAKGVRRKWLAAAAVVVYGALVALAICRHFFLLPADTFFENHDGISYLLRSIEFRDCLANGYLSPQWCTNFRSGLGSPHFSYYQPAFFYCVSMTPQSLSPSQQVGLVLWGFTLIGFLATYRLVSRRFGAWAGLFCGTILITSLYASTEIYIRGDFSEYAAMMWVTVVVLMMDSVLESPSFKNAIGLVLSGGVLITLHPCIALVTYGLLVLFILLYGAKTRKLIPGALSVVSLMAGGGIAAFYWFPVFFEWHYVSPDKAFSGEFHFSKHFVSLSDLLLPGVTHSLIPIKLGLLSSGILAASLLAYWWRRKSLDGSQRRLAAFCVCTLCFCLFFLNGVSEPLWSNLPLLHRLQFPWRLLSLLTIAVAGLGGLLMPSRPQAKHIAGSLVCSCLLIVQMFAVSRIARVPTELPTSAHEITTFYFAPDIQDEWLPKGAVNLGHGDWGPVAADGIELRNFQRNQGRLSVEFSASKSGTIVLPQYYFADGWEGRLNGSPINLEQSNEGLISVNADESTSGLLTVVFTSTRMRLWGIAVSCCTLLACAIAYFVDRRWRSRRVAAADQSL